MGRNHATFGREIQFRKVVIDTQSHIGPSCSSDDKEAACNAGDLGSIPGSETSFEKREWQSTPIFLLGESHRQRSLEDYSLWGGKELDTERLTLTYLLRVT